MSKRASGQKSAEKEKENDPAAVALGREGGLKGGRTRAEAMTLERRAEKLRE